MQIGLFKTGERIPATGIYTVHHAAHRLPHNCTLIEGHAFPPCSKCGDAVAFHCVTVAPLWEAGPHPIVLYELPEVA
jgi:hypothetical protein